MHNQLENGKKYHYFYKITNINTGEYYYGIHSTNNLKDKYMGSGVRLNRLYKIFGKKCFKKEILKFFNNRTDALNYEKEVVNEKVISDIYCLNMIEGGVGSYTDCSTKGLVTVRDANNNYFSVSVLDPRYLSGELVHTNTGFVTVKDKDGNYYRVSKDDPRYLSKKLIPASVGFVTVKDKDGNYFNITKSDPKYLSGELISVNSGFVTVRDKDGNCFRTLTSDPRYLSGELTIVSKGNKGAKGYTYIYKDGEYKSIKKIDLDEYIKDGWEIRSKCRGRTSPTKGMLWISKDDESKVIKKEELQSYLDQGWINERNISPCKDKIGIIKDGVNKYVSKEELQTYLDQGWELGMSSRNKGMVTVYDPLKPNEKCFSVAKDDPRFVSGELKLAVFKKYNMGLGGSCKGLKYINKDGVIKRVNPEELQSYLNDGWCLGMKK